MKKWFEETLGLKTHGDSLLSTSARRMINALTIALFIQFMIDLFVWTRVAMYGLNSIVFAILGGLAVSTLIYLVDRGIAVMDLTQRKTAPILFRLMVVLVFAIFSAVPLQMTVFEPDINARINSEEGSVRAALMDKATKEENARFDDLLKKAEENNDSIISTIKQERDPKRKALVATQENRRRFLTQQITDARDRLAEEMAGQSASRKRGYGIAAKAAEAQVQKAAADLKDAESIMATELKLFDELTEKKIDLALSEVNANRDRILADKNSTFRQIQSAPTNDLARKYGGKWDVSHGFLRRYSELQHLKDSDATVGLVSHACEAIMVSLALLVLLLKLMGGQALKTYYSDMAQARHKGDNLTYEGARASGYDEEGINMMSLPQRARDKMEQIHQYRLDVCKAYSKHLSSVAHVCSEGDLGKASLQERIRKSFEAEVADKVAKLRSAEEKLYLEGFKPLEWSDKLPYPENVATNWQIPEEKLREMGWRDPEKKAAEKAVDRMKKLYLELTENFYNYEGQLRMRIIKDPNQSKEELINWAHRYYTEEIVPRLKELAECEMAIIHGGLKVPEPPSGLPSEEELRQIGQIPASVLAKLGGEEKPSGGATNGSAKGSIHPV